MRKRVEVLSFVPYFGASQEKKKGQRERALTQGYDITQNKVFSDRNILFSDINYVFYFGSIVP